MKTKKLLISLFLAGAIAVTSTGCTDGEISINPLYFNIAKSVITNLLTASTESPDSKAETPEGDSNTEESIVEEQITVTPDMTDALNKAKSYLSSSPCSPVGLVEQLQYDGYSEEAAKYAVANCGANWQIQAMKITNIYLDNYVFSRAAIIEQLEYEGFTHEDAIYGADHCGINWQDMAVKTAELYMTEYSLSKAELIEQLEIDGFPTEDAIYAADNCGISWN